MKPATVKQLKDELKIKSQGELVELCLRLSKFKKDNKELLTYLLFEADSEEDYIQAIKEEIDDQFQELNRSSMYRSKKSIRKILRTIKKYIRYSGQKQTEVEVLIYFCQVLRSCDYLIFQNTVVRGIFDRQLVLIEKAKEALHQDLQGDYDQDIKDLKET